MKSAPHCRACARSPKPHTGNSGPTWRYGTALDEGVVVAHARTRVRGLDAEPVQHGQHRGGLECGGVVVVSHGIGGQGGDAFGQRGAVHMGEVVVFMDFPADDLAAVEVQNQVEVVPASGALGRLQFRSEPRWLTGTIQ